jgi:(2Fe-2S) ferredoxin/predicted O-methyltransferase YrrM
MEPFRYHVYVCDQKKPEGAPCCSARGSGAVIDALRREVAKKGLDDLVHVTVSGSLGLCERGPNLVVYPEGVWYSGIAPSDVPEIVHSHFQEGVPVARLVRQDVAELRQEVTENRRKMLAAMRALDAAGALPDDLVTAFRAYQDSRILLSAVELDVFSAVADGAPAAALAAALGTDARGTEALLNALVALGLLHKKEGVYLNAPVAKRFLTAGSPDDARTGLRHHLSLWERWSRLSECVRTGRPASSTEMKDRGDEWTVPFIAAMHRNAASRAPLVVEAVGARGVRKLLDVGGGSGAYSIAFARANPELRAEIFDLATVVPIAERHLAEAGLTDRVRSRVGDLRTDSLGEGYDLVLLSAICHMLGPDENRDLLRRAFEALGPKGRVVVQDFILEPDKTAPRTGAIFAINMLVGTERGSSYSYEEYAAWLAEAGFRDVRRIPLPGPSDLVLGTRP